MAKLKAVSLFSGCGGFDWGATQAGIKIIWANDVDPYAASAYKSILPKVPFTLGDVRKIDCFPEADILIGCYPCTGFSLAARRRWKERTERNLMETEGNFLFREFVRALRQVRPKYFFVENVSGMVSALDGWFFKQQLEEFNRIGFSTQVSVLSATDFGVAQSRKRIFIVGIHKDLVDEVSYEFPKPTHGINKKKQIVSLQDIIGNMPLWPEGDFSQENFHGHYLTRNRKRNWNEPSFTIVANASHVPLHPHGEPMIKVGTDKWTLQGDFNRRLSWRECAMIQGLPNTLLPDGNLHAKYRVVGNAVPPAFGKALLKPIIKFEKAFTENTKQQQ